MGGSDEGEAMFATSVKQEVRQLLLSMLADIH
jgi:hypothetical protein